MPRSKGSQGGRAWDAPQPDADIQPIPNGKRKASRETNSRDEPDAGDDPARGDDSKPDADATTLAQPEANSDTNANSEPLPDPRIECHFVRPELGEQRFKFHGVGSQLHAG